MSDEVRVKESYTLAKCCSPRPGDAITGYYSHDRILLKVHRSDCANLDKAPADRLVSLAWDDILDETPEQPGADYDSLTPFDFRVMSHHREYGVDYSLKVAAILHADKQAVFDSHAKLRTMKILTRVEPLIIQYRKGIVDNKWIKHRNHTYYELTDKGNSYLDFHLGADDDR
jgi:hypothetical protein